MGDSINLILLLCRGSLDFIQGEKVRPKESACISVDVRETNAMESMKDFGS